MKREGAGCWFVGAVCPCGYNLLTFDFVRLIVGYVATRDQEEEAAAEEEETDCNVARGGGAASPSQTAGHFDVALRCGKRVIYLLFILILSRIFYSFLVF